MFESLTAEQKIRMTLHKDVRAICQEASHHVGMEIQTHAMELIAELVWKKLHLFGTDLECFAKHAKRSTINQDDVKLLVRRNPSLKAHITKLAESNASSSSKEVKRKRSTNATNAQNNTPVAKVNSSDVQLNNAEPVPSTSSTSHTFIEPTIINTNNNSIKIDKEHSSPFINMLCNKIATKPDDEDDDFIDLT